MPHTQHEHPSRRACDHCESDGHGSPCDKLKDHAVDLATVQVTLGEVLTEIREMRKDQKVVKDIVVAIDNVRGFTATMKSLGKSMMWTVAFFATCAALAELLKHWLGVK